MEKLGEDPMALGGNIAALELHTLGEYPGLGVGTIDPQTRLDSGEIEIEKLEELKSELQAGVYNIPVAQRFIKWCVDGRTRANDVREADPNGAGGTLSLVYGRALSPSPLDPPLTTDLELTKTVVEDLNSKEKPVGVHGDEHSSCGCGACLKAKEIFGSIAEFGDSIRAVYEDHGGEVSAHTHDGVVMNAKKRLEEKFFIENRSEILDAATDGGGEKETYMGVHNEVIVILNTIDGTTIDRAAIRAKYGPAYDVFVVDVWAFEESAAVLNQTGYDQETQDLVAAMAYYNFATAAQLGGKSLGFLPIAA